MIDGYSYTVTAVASRTHKDESVSRVAITVPVCETHEDQHRLFKLVREWVMSDEFWADAKKNVDFSANNVRRGGNAVTFMPEELGAERH